MGNPTQSRPNKIAGVIVAGIVVVCLWLILLRPAGILLFIFKDTSPSSDLGIAMAAEARSYFTGLLGLTAIFCIPFGVLLLLSQKRRPRVFLSYHSEDSPVAIVLEERLTERGIDVFRDSLTPDLHDRVVARLRSEISSADALVVIPGGRRSWVDAEVLAATALNKVVVFVARDSLDDLPDTALSGYPTFSCDRLLAQDCQALAEFLKYVLTHWTSTRSLWGKSVDLAMKIAAALFMVPYAILWTIRIFNPLLFSRWVSLYTWATIITAGAIMLVLGTYTIYCRVRAVAVARQAIVTGKATYRLLESSLFMVPEKAKILGCLRNQPLRARKKVSSIDS